MSLSLYLSFYCHNHYYYCYYCYRYRSCYCCPYDYYYYDHYYSTYYCQCFHNYEYNFHLSLSLTQYRMTKIVSYHFFTLFSIRCRVTDIVVMKMIAIKLLNIIFCKIFILKNYLQLNIMYKDFLSY